MVLLVGLLATGITAVYAHRLARARDGLRFEAAVLEVTSGIRNHVDTHTTLLRAGAGLFAANPDVTAKQFQDFATRLNLRRHYPGIQGIGFAVRVDAANVPRFVDDVKRAGHPGFGIWPATPREIYFPIVYLEPRDKRNQAAIGYDMFTEPVRNEAMTRAARTGSASASGRVTLVQEIDPEKQAGFLIYVPVYRDGSPSPDPANGDPVRQLRGFIYSPFRAGDFLSSVFANPDDGIVRVRLYDEQVSESRLLFDSHHGSNASLDSGRFQATSRIQVAGRTWVAVINSIPQFEVSAERRFLPWILGVGLLVTLLLTGATWQEVHARAEAEETAERLRRSEEALRASEARLRQLVEAERQASLEASEASRAKDEFLATLSHELRTPLNAILGWATMLTSGRLSDSQRERAVQVIARNAQTQADLIEDLLDVSRIITGKMRIEMRPTNLAGPVQAALDAVRPSAEVKGIRLARRFETEGAVIGDPDRLQQVAWNLLSNAIKFTPTGGRVDVTLERVEGVVALRVADTGVGIAPTFLPHVFERFRQHDSSTTREHGGMGIGLALVRHLVEAHGGTVEAESAGPDQGSTFIVRLPARGGPRDQESLPAEHQQPADAAALWLAGRNVVIVDDDADSRELLAGMARSAGAAVEAVASAPEALERLESGGVDLLLADISMPGVDGYQLIAAIRAHSSPRVSQVIAIAVTAHARREDREAALAAGFQEHLSKPLDVNRFRSAIRLVPLRK